MFRFKNILFVIFAIILSANNYSQTPCESGFAAVSGGETFPCNDYDLMSNIPISVLANSSGNPEGSDIWGWTDPLNDKEYVLFGTTNSTAFVDISDPVNPIFLGRLNSAFGTSLWRDVKVYNNYAFIVADNIGPHGMQVFDLTLLRDGVDADLTFNQVEYPGRITTYTGDPGEIEISSCHNIVINESEAIAYLVGCDDNGGGPIFIDISNPISPNTLGDYSTSGYTHDAQVITYNGPDTSPDPNTTSIPTYVGREILVASNGSFSSEDKLVVLDVTDKNNVFKISEITYPQSGYAHQGWFTDDHRYFIMGDETDEQSFGMNSRTLIFDMSNLDLPVLFSTYFGVSTAIDHNGYVKGDLFFLANYRAGMRVLDIPSLLSASTTNPAISEVGYFDTYPENNNTSYRGAWSIYPYFSSGNIIIGDINRGLFIVRKTGTLSTISSNVDTAFQLLPNPSDSDVTISTKNNDLIKSVEIYNTLGQIVFEKNNINLQKFVLPTKKYAKGLYLVKINGQKTKKLLIK